MNSNNKIKISKNQIDIHWDHAKQQSNIQSKTYLELFIVFLTISVMLFTTVFSGTIHVFFIFPAIGSFFISIIYINHLRLLPDELLISYKETMIKLDKLKYVKQHNVE